MFESFANLVKSLYPDSSTVALHEPVLGEREKSLLSACIDSTFVSTVGPYVEEFENKVADLAGSTYAVATLNGTSALHAALLAVGVEPGSLVITQPLTFVATCNAISYCGAEPLFVDIDPKTLGMSPKSLRNYLENETRYKNGRLCDKRSGKYISAILPVHTFGFPCEMETLVQISGNYDIPVIEDAAESLGSRLGEKHTGTFANAGVFSFNGNKIVTTGGGGIVVTDDAAIAQKIRHITTTAKTADPFHSFHDEIGFNYRMPNLNAALGCAQLERLDHHLKAKRSLANLYRRFFEEYDHVTFIDEPANTHSNYWLNSILFKEPKTLYDFLEYTHSLKIYTRAAWTPMYKLPMFSSCYRHETGETEEICSRLANLPSSASANLKGNV